jgi:hypothetical protein
MSLHLSLCLRLYLLPDQDTYLPTVILYSALMRYPLCYLQLYTVLYGSTPFYTASFAVDPQPKTVLAMDRDSTDQQCL